MHIVLKAGICPHLTYTAYILIDYWHIKNLFDMVQIYNCDPGPQNQS